MYSPLVLKFYIYLNITIYLPFCYMNYQLQTVMNNILMADVLIYLVQLADRMDVDLEEEVYKKLEKNGVKYPVK